MKQYIAWLFVLSLFGASSVVAGSDYHAPGVTGKKARKQVRHFLYAKNLTGDKKAVFDEYGYTHNRLRFSMGGKVTERWRYYDRGLEFTFDQEGSLIEKREIAREDRRGWVYEE